MLVAVLSTAAGRLYIISLLIDLIRLVNMISLMTFAVFFGQSIGLGNKNSLSHSHYLLQVL